jgi:hypothetical protein
MKLECRQNIVCLITQRARRRQLVATTLAERLAEAEDAQRALRGSWAPLSKKKRMQQRRTTKRCRITRRPPQPCSWRRWTVSDWSERGP